MFGDWLTEYTLFLVKWNIYRDTKVIWILACLCGTRAGAGPRKLLLEGQTICDSESSRDHGSWLCLQSAHLGFPPAENLANRTDRDQYELLCLDNSRMPVDKYRECNLGLFPSHAVVARNVGGKEDLIWELLNQAQVFPPSILTSYFVCIWGGSQLRFGAFSYIPF